MHLEGQEKEKNMPPHPVFLGFRFMTQGSASDIVK